MSRHRDPLELTPAERLEEIAMLLARGYRRHQLHSDQKGLAESGPVEALCERPVDGSEANAGQEDVA